MHIFYSKRYLKKSAKKVSRDPDLQKQIRSALFFLERDEHRPHLRIHKLKGNRQEQYAVWIRRNTRLIFLMINTTDILLLDLITHDEY